MDFSQFLSLHNFNAPADFDPERYFGHRYALIRHFGVDSWDEVMENFHEARQEAILDGVRDNYSISDSLDQDPSSPSIGLERFFSPHSDTEETSDLFEQYHDDEFVWSHSQRAMPHL
jgi:hypothetical protein